VGFWVRPVHSVEPDWLFGIHRLWTRLRLLWAARSRFGRRSGLSSDAEPHRLARRAFVSLAGRAHRCIEASFITANRNDCRIQTSPTPSRLGDGW
jgi:hypothetical protein